VGQKKVPLWILKTEPETFGWSHQLEEGTAVWDGVRNHQAKANLQKMKCGELAYFYHSGKRRELVGIVEVVREAYPDPSDETGRWVAVDVKPHSVLLDPVELKVLKSMTELAESALVKQSRLSVIPLSLAEGAAVFSILKTTLL